MAPVAAYLRLHAVQVFPYIDDWLVVSRSRYKALRDMKFTLDVLRNLGLTVNHKKSHLVPSQIVDYIGVTLDATRGRIFLPQDRIRKIKKAVKKFRAGVTVTALHAQHLLGLMSSTTPGLAHARLKLRSLQIWLLTLFNPFKHHQNK